MQSKLYLTLAVAAVATLTSCSKLGKLSADDFTVTPSPLEATAMKVPATISGRFPVKFMKKKAVITITPVLRYKGGEAFGGDDYTFQGEKVRGNNTVVSYKQGGTYTMRPVFNYIPAMEKSQLYLTFKARLGKKTVQIPEVKIADGVLATSTLAPVTAQSATATWAVDQYQYAIAKKKQAEIKYLIQQAKIRSSQLKTASVKEFVDMLRSISQDKKGYQIDNVEVSAYASPDGGMKLNTALAKNREKTSTGYVQKQLKKAALNTYLDSKYTSEDWEGFKELVSASNIQDKDVILRVLSMYKDPEEREKQIKSMSVAFRELANEILPQLRRARLTINYQVLGRTDAEIQAQYQADPAKLSVEELLYNANLSKDSQAKKQIYMTTVRLYPNDYRAYNNLATLAYNSGDLAEAEKCLNEAAAINANAPEVNANRALLALAKNNVADAEMYLSKASNAKNYNEVLGNLNLAKGNYAEAEKDLENVYTNSAVLAQILNKDYVKAEQTLQKVANRTAITEYLGAILAARMNQISMAEKCLKKACSKDSKLLERAANDLELSSLHQRAACQAQP